MQHGNFWRYAAVCAVLEAETLFFRQFDVVLLPILLCSWPAMSRTLLVMGDPLCGALSFALTWLAERPSVGTFRVTHATLRIRLVVCSASVALLCWAIGNRYRFRRDVTATDLNLDSSSDPQADVYLACVLGILMVLCRAATRPTTSFLGIMFASVIQEHPLVEAEQRQDKSVSDAQQDGFDDTCPGSSSHQAPVAVVQNDIAGKYWMLRAALVKPLNSLGPILGTAVLSAAGYENRQKDFRVDSHQAPVNAGLWWTSAALPSVVSWTVSLLVIRVWGRFTLHGARLEKVAGEAAAQKGARSECSKTP